MMDDREREAFLAYATLPMFERRVEQARSIIRDGLALGSAYVGWSIGKDSTAMLHLAQQEKPDVTAIHIRTPKQELLNDYDRVIQEYTARFLTVYSEVEVGLETLMPSATTQLKLWNDYPVAMIGIRAQENPKKRGSTISRFGQLHQYKTGERKGSWGCYPLALWDWKDVWAYTVLHDLPYLKSYDHPTQSDRAQSRTTNVIPFTHGSVGHRHGRIEALRILSPEAYQFLREEYPQLTN